MMIAARNAFLMSGGSSTPTARDYVQDGLVAMWDAKDNIWFGRHSDNASIWSDLSGNGIDMISNGTPVFYADYIQPTSVANLFHTDVTDKMDGVLQSGKFTMEVVSLGVMQSTPLLIFGGGSLSQNGIAVATYNYSNRYGAHGRFGGSDARAWGTPSTPPIGTFTVRGDGTKVHAKFLGFDGTSYFANANISPPASVANSKRFAIGYRYSYSQDGPMTNGTRVYTIRTYSRALADAEVAANYAVDAARFTL